MPSIESIDLTKRYGAFVAVSNLNLKLEGAKCIGFLGPNGAGKTTTLKMLTDLIRPSSGSVLIDGIDVRKNKKDALASVGTLIEMPEIYPALTPREALTMIAELRGVPKEDRKEQIEAVVSEVQMAEWIDKRIGKFSKGMKQRICVASALIGNPSIIILDEPTSGLDPRGMSEVRDIIKSLKSKNRLIFMSSHLLSEVSDICDDVAMIDHGKLIVYDGITDVVSKVSGGQNVVEVGLKEAVNDRMIEMVAANLKGIVKVEKNNGNTFCIRFEGGLNAQARILDELMRLKIGIVSYRSASSALEEAYLSLVKDTA
jgi:ABC-2 type transport system ATP-binding protein